MASRHPFGACMAILSGVSYRAVTIRFALISDLKVEKPAFRCRCAG